MEIMEFFQQCAGKWFSQRTSHALPPQEMEAGKSDLWIDILSADDRAVLELCQTSEIDAVGILCGMQTRWEGTVGTASKPDKGSALLVAIADSPHAGKFVRRGNSPAQTPMTGSYTLNTDESLTLIVESETLRSEERLWFVTPNLRERTSVITHASGASYASFCSEIRMGSK
jgi:phycoerythrin-associated linker protein